MTATTRAAMVATPTRPRRCLAAIPRKYLRRGCPSIRRITHECPESDIRVQGSRRTIINVRITTDPAAVGLDPIRLAAMDAHFARYVDDGRLAGWQIVITRRGEVAHASTYGLADREAGTAVAPDTVWRIYSMTKPITSVAAMML